jgi:transposase-like protein
MSIESMSVTDLLNAQRLEVGDRVSVSLEFADTEGYLHPTELVNKPEWLPERAVLPIFQGYLERFKKSGASSFKSSSQDEGYKFAFEVKEQLATLTITKESESMSPKGPKKGATRQRFTDEIKEQVVDALRSGLTSKDAADKFDVSVASINLWKKAAGLTGGKRGRKPGSGKPKGESTPRAAKKGSADSITLNGTLYVPAKSIEVVKPKPKTDLIKILNRLEAELSNLRSLILD